MPSIKRVNVGTTTNAVEGLLFSELARRAFLTLYASCVTVTDLIGMSINSVDIIRGASPNLEATDVVDTARDLIVHREPVGAGKIFIPITATTAVNFLLVIEYI
jgi:hypothetical protein